MYEKSFWLVDFLYVLVIYQHNEPFKIIGVFIIIILEYILHNSQTDFSWFFYAADEHNNKSYWFYCFKIERFYFWLIL